MNNKCEVELQGVDLHAGMDSVIGFGTATEDADNTTLWLQNDQDYDLDASMFYTDFPTLTDFPCMSLSSSSSSSSTPTPVKNNRTCSTITTTTTISSSSSMASSSAASWAVMRSEVEEDVEKNYNFHHHMQQQDHQVVQQPSTLSSTASMEISQPPPSLVGPGLDGGIGGVGDGMDDMMDTFGYMELLEANDYFFDSASILQENPLSEEFSKPQQLEEHAHVAQQQHQEPEEDMQLISNNEGEIIQGENGNNDDDDEMSKVFLEWLKSNKDNVSANDLRNVKLKKATIECAARRLGGGKEAMKQLLKLILEWVQSSHLQNKRRKEENNDNNNDNNTPNSNILNTQFQDPSSFVAPESNTCFNNSPWMMSPAAPPPYANGADQTPLMVAAPPFSQPMLGYVCDPYSNGGSTSNNINGSHSTYPPAATEYHMMESAPLWPSNQSFGDHRLHSLAPSAAAFAGFGNGYPYHQFFHGLGGDGLMRLGPSVTREARKKRMARQRRYLSHHRHHHNNHQQNQGSADTHSILGSNNCTNVVAAGHANPANWVYWHTMVGGAAASVAPVILAGPVEPPAAQQVMDHTAMQTQNCHQGRVSSDRRQQGNWKPENNLRFLLQKVLKQSDVGNLGRIVLPKKEAETHLPELEARDGISITMEDIGTSRVWNMRYRYWPNNKSRMYLLENTGDFVKANGLQEGDFIVIYSDVKCGKFMIRGVKVRQQGAKSETKKAGKSQKNLQHGNNAATTAGNN